MKKLLFFVLFVPAILNGAANNVEQAIQGLQNNFNGIANMQNNDQRRQAYQNFGNQARVFLEQQNQNLNNQQRDVVEKIVRSAALRARANPQNLFAQGMLGVADVEMQDANNDPMDVIEE